MQGIVLKRSAKFCMIIYLVEMKSGIINPGSIKLC